MDRSDSERERDRAIVRRWYRNREKAYGAMLGLPIVPAAVGPSGRRHHDVSRELAIDYVEDLCAAHRRLIERATQPLQDEAVIAKATRASAAARRKREAAQAGA